MKLYKHIGKFKGVSFLQVIDVHILSDEMRIFTVTDGTSFIYCLHHDEDQRHATYEVRIIVLNPSPELKKIKVNIAVIYCFCVSFKLIVS
jgi:hypothetical protein